MHRKVQVWIHLRLENRTRVLILKMRRQRGGFWQPVTGSVEKGETLRQAALREAQEESGLDFSGGPKTLGYRFRFASSWGGECEETTYALSARLGKNGELPEVTLDPKEHTDYDWVSPSAALRIIHFPSNRQALKILMKSLNERKLHGSRKTNH